MRPEARKKVSTKQDYLKLGIPEEWIEVVQLAGYTVVEEMKGINPNKLHMELCGLNKKNKLGLNNPKPEEVKAWIENLES
jgi:lysyl-tRNA synthetase class 2